jgi:hypothetical protein
MKTCTQCNETKPYTEFHKDRRAQGGLVAKCKSCKASYRASYYSQNRDRLIAYQNEYFANRYESDPAFAVVHCLRSRLRNVIDRRSRTSRELVGCSVEKLMAWLELHFDEGMTWENHGEWHIDHIRPIASFDDPEDPECWNWTNLQPLWATDNLRKQ